MKVDIVSGFLGAGKTSLIKRIIELNTDEKIAIIENEFGEVNIDSSIINKTNIEIKEINSGCICCTVSGDLIKGIEDLYNTYDIDRLIIEPTGIAKLSQIKNTIEDLNIERLKSITVIDPNNYFIYLENFGKFYRDQIKNAEIIFISRAQTKTDKELNEIRESLNVINQNAKLLCKNISDLRKDDFKNTADKRNKQKMHISKGVQIKRVFSKTDTFKFESISFELERRYSLEQLKYLIDSLRKINEDNSEQTILRAKGLVLSEGSNLHFEFLPNTEKIEKYKDDIDIGKAVIIGINLNQKEIISIFEKE